MDHRCIDLPSCDGGICKPSDAATDSDDGACACRAASRPRHELGLAFAVLVGIVAERRRRRIKSVVVSPPVHAEALAKRTNCS
jgi:hypothetical protein